jgi:hypothetical protein
VVLRSDGGHLNIRLGRTCVATTNTLAYVGKAWITAATIFMAAGTTEFGKILKLFIANFSLMGGG